MRRSSWSLSLLSLSTHSSRTSGFLASLIACLFVIASPLWAQSAPVLVTQAVDNSVRTVLTGNVHPLARAAFDQGEVPAGMPLHRMLLVLKRSDQQETALRRLIENQQYKGSSSYHQWLTPQEFGAQFGPANSDMAAVVGWLTASGFEVTQVTNGRNIVEFNGTAGQVKQAFGTALHKYVINGEEHIANSTNPSIPTALAPIVAGINSLHDFRKKAQNKFVGTFSKDVKTGKVVPINPLTDFGPGCAPSGEDCQALGPYDFANIYDVLPLWTAATPINGTGVTIAIVGRTDINPSDATTFWSLFGLDGTHAPQPTLNIFTNGPDPGFTGDEPEADIDTQWSGAVAPGATIDFVTSASTETDDGVDLSALYIVDNNLAPVMSESYGACEAAIGSGGVFFYGGMWEEAAAQGISVMVSTGDNGAAGCDFGPDAVNGLNVNGLASTPWNAAVGGTDFNQYNKWSTYWNSSNAPITQQSVKSNTYIPETTWDNSCTNPLFVTLGFGATAEAACNNPNLPGYVQFGGGSGGKSGYSAGVLGGAPGWATPTWQTGIPNPNDDVRDLPDVSLLASNGFMGSFYLICQSDFRPGNGQECTLNDLQGYGGTSVASPAFAGIMALVNQLHGPQGVPGLILYSLAAKQPSAFHDINILTGTTTTTISMPCAKSSPDCTVKVAADSVGVLNGYNTAAGYDLATGLGSVDAANLVNNWSKVTFTPSTTTLTLTVPPGTTHGASLNVTVGVTGAGGTPTGDVSLLVAPVPGTGAIDWNTLASGTITWPTTLFPGGTYQVIAHYAGDTTFGGSYSTPSASITITPEISTVYMPGIATPGGYSPGPVVYGSNFPGCDYTCDSYWLRTDIQNSQGQYCTTPSQGFIACPTGTVTFTDNGTAVPGGPFKVNSYGYTDDYSVQLLGGSHTLVANFTTGDLSYKSGSSTPVVITVSTAPTTFNSVTAPSSANTNQNFTVTATLATTSYGVAPTGTVKFFANGVQLPGTVTYAPTNGGVSGFAALGASLTTSISTAASYTITATYTGDTNYTSQASSPSAVIVVSNPTPDFTPAVNATPNTTLANVNVQWGGTLTALNGYNKPVTLSCAAGAPTTCTFSPSATITPLPAPGANFTVTVGSSTAATYNFNIQGTDGTITHTQAVSLTVNPDFSVPATLANPAAANPGQSTSTMMALAPVGAGTFTSNVTYACTSGLPTGATCSFNPAQINSGQAGQSVTVTVQTAGPFTGAAAAPGARPRLRSQKQPLRLPLSLPLAGVLLMGLAGRKLPRRYKIVGLCLALALTGLLVACGGGSSSPPPAVVTVSPSTVNTLYPSLAGAPAQTKQFSATVSNSTSQSVTWAVTGGSANGSIDQTGLYTAPATLPNPNSPITITATSTAATSPGTATVNLQTPTPAGTPKVTVTVTEGAVQHTTTFTLTVN